MKVLLINNATTHYYNLLLNRLNAVSGLQVTVVTPTEATSNVGVGVYQTRDGIDFRVCELQEKSRMGGFSSFKGLTHVVWREKPDVIIVNDGYLLGLLFNIPLTIIRRLLGTKLILRTIPFRVPTYQAAKDKIRGDWRRFAFLPGALNSALATLGLARLLRWFYLGLVKWSYRASDGHMNYIHDAFRIYGSYGVPKERIFVTGNSPDTDTLFAARAEVEKLPPVLPPCEHRLIHVGRLVAWKRVDLLLRAHARIKKEFLNAELVVLGDGPEEASLRRLTKELGVEDSVRFVAGVYKPKHLGQYLMASSIYVLAGMGGLSINDAMCFGLPVICSVCDGTEKILVRDGFNGKLFRDGDEDDLVDKIGQLCRNLELRQKMGVHSTEIIQNEVNIHTVVARYVKAIEAVTHGRVAPGGK